MAKLTLDSHFMFYKYVCYYTYEKYKDKIPDFQYLSQSTIRPYQYVLRCMIVTIQNLMLKCVVPMIYHSI